MPRIMATPPGAPHPAFGHLLPARGEKGNAASLLPARGAKGNAAVSSRPARRGEGAAKRRVRDARSLRLLGAARLHLIGARRLCGLRFESADRADVCDELPDLKFRNVSAERRHAVRSSFGDRFVNVRRRTSVDPLLIHQRRTDSAAAVEVTSDAVVLLVELLPLTDRVRVSFVWILHRRRGEKFWSWLQRRFADRHSATRSVRGDVERTTLAMTCERDEAERDEPNENACEPSVIL